MRHKGPLFAFLTLLVLSVAACGGIGGGYSPLPSPAASASAQNATVNFLVIVPSAGTTAAHRKPQFVTSSNAQSVSFTLDSVNGTAPSSATPTVVNLTSSTAGCEQTTAQLTCNVNVSAPAGTLVFTVKVYAQASAGGTVIEEGNVSVTATSGGSVSAPLTLTGTIASLSVAIGGVAELGASASVPVTLQAKDANGNTIIGTYNETITVSDTDSSGQTALSASSIPDSTTAAGLTLTYQGGAMASPATIAASGSGLTSASATFSPDTNYPTVDGNQVSFNETYSYSYGVVGQPTNGPYSSSYSYSEDYATGQSYAGVSNAIAINDNGESTYYAWIANGSSAELGYLGYSSNDESETCSSPYYIEFEIPIPSSWNAYSGTGSCSETYNYYYSPTEVSQDSATYNNDGSYSETYSYNYTYCCTGDFGNGNAAVTSSGNANEYDNTGDGSDVIAMTAPSANAATVAVSLVSYPSGTFPPTTPAPTATTAPNPFGPAGAALSSGTEPSPLVSDVYTSGGTLAASALPAACAVSTSIVPSTSTLTLINESLSSADPLEDGYYEEVYYSEQIAHYYLPGVGDICDNYAYSEYDYDDGSLSWFDGSDTEMDLETGTQTDYITATDLTAQLKRRGMTQAFPAAAALFEAASRSHMNALHRAQSQALRKARLAHKRGPVIVKPSSVL